MKLFVVVYVTQHMIIGGVLGPLPYGMDECNKRADTLQAEYEQVYRLDDTRIHRITFSCEFHEGYPSPETGKLRELVE